MFCAISGEVPKEPVISKNGVIFDKSLITKYLGNGSSTCPVTNSPLSADDLIEVKVSSSTAAKPRLPISETNSIPGLLKTFQNEWDELMLETFTLKQHLDATRRELSHALFQHEAACRVIARLQRERDEAQHMIHTMQTKGDIAEEMATAPIGPPATFVPATAEVTDGNMSSKAQSNGEEAGIDKEVLQEINEKCKQLSSTRKGRKSTEGLTSKEAMTTLTQVASYTPHKADNRVGGIACLDITKNDEGSLVSLTGGLDKAVILTDLSTGKVIQKISGHSKKVNSVNFLHSGIKSFTSASADKSVKLWSSSGNGKYQEKWTYADHSAEVTDSTIHPTGNYMISTCADSSWYFFNLVKGQLMKKVSVEDDFQYNSCAFHPDGLILGTGTNKGNLKIWDVREQQNVANCEEHSAAIKSISFSENGYLVATGSDDGTAKIWDLRKLQCTKTMEMGKHAVNAVAFDKSVASIFLGVAGGTELGAVHLKIVKEWTDCVVVPKQNKAVTAVCFSENAEAMVTTGLDRTVRVYKPSV